MKPNKRFLLHPSASLFWENNVMKTFLFNKEKVFNQLKRVRFDIEHFASDEWHFFVAMKPK